MSNYLKYPPLLSEKCNFHQPCINYSCRAVIGKSMLLAHDSKLTQLWGPRFPWHLSWALFFLETPKLFAKPFDQATWSSWEAQHPDLSPLAFPAVGGECGSDPGSVLPH